MMLPVLGAVLAIETALGFLLVSKVPPLEKLACFVMDLTKTTRGSAVTKTLAGTLLIFMASSVSTYVTAKSHILRSQSGGEGHMHIDHSETYILRTAELESALSGTFTSAPIHSTDLFLVHCWTGLFSNKTSVLHVQ